MSAPTAEERQLAEPWFAIIATGDGAETVVVPESALHQRLHDVYCACGFTWALCDDADTLKLISSLDDEDRWTHEYPARVRHVWRDSGEDYSVTVSRLTEPLAAEREKQELRRVLQLALIPLAALVVSGECVDAPSALTEELKLAILQAHDEVLTSLRPQAEALLGRKP